MLYGPAQTINSAVYALVNTFSEVQRLDSSETTEILIGKILYFKNYAKDLAKL